MVPFRTGITKLSDDELVLLDIVAIHTVLPQMLRVSVFEATWALGYCHSINDFSLKQAIKNLRRRGLIAFDRSRGDARICATSRGGKAWASERLPIWNLFVCVELVALPEGRQHITVWSPGKSTPDIYLGSMASQEYELDNRILTQPDDDWGILPWTRFATLFSASADIVHDDGPSLSFDAYESNRAHWSNVRELQKFVRKCGDTRH